jgi:hypothetical protein
LTGVVDAKNLPVNEQTSRPPLALAKEAAMKDIHCLLGRHDWSTQLPDDAVGRHGEHRVVCTRCGKVARAGSGHDLSLGGPMKTGGID